MKPLYFLLWIALPYILAVFYRRRKVIGTQKKFYAQTIFVCNHPSAFIDPLIIANYHRPIIHFMTRSDVFKPWLKPITWACHMVPIYRMAEDGNENFDKNTNSFQAAINVLKNKKSLIMFGEGYTDDVFIRSLKPLKKGPARIAFMAMKATDWQEDIKIQAVGVNYTNPGKFNCELIISAGRIIRLKDYQKEFEENPNKAQTQLIREIEKELQNQITYVKNKNLAPFVENIMAITRNGLNHECSNKNIPLVKRYQYSKNLATTINEQYDENNETWTSLKSDLENYFKAQQKDDVNENWIYKYGKAKTKKLAERFALLIFGFPFFLIGVVHNFIPYIIAKKLTEKMMKRKVFWSGVKLMLGALLDTLYNLPVIWLFYNYVHPSYWMGFSYFMIVPAASGIIAYNYAILFKDTIKIMKFERKKLEDYLQKRNNLEAKINALNL